jgi:radical SAM superfamily enzyme
MASLDEIFDRFAPRIQPTFGCIYKHGVYELRYERINGQIDTSSSMEKENKVNTCRAQYFQIWANTEREYLVLRSFFESYRLSNMDIIITIFGPDVDIEDIPVSNTQSKHVI